VALEIGEEEVGWMRESTVADADRQAWTEQQATTARWVV
jgi:hypothetical protein